MPNELKGNESRNEGESNRTAARRYNEEQHEFVKSGKIDKAAKEAKRAVEGGDAEDLKHAEEEGRSHNHGEDPQLKKKTDYAKGGH